MVGAKSDVKCVILRILFYNLLADRMIYNTILIQIRLIVSFTEIIIVYSIFLFDDFSNSVLRGSRYIYYFDLLILKDILDDDAVIIFIFLPNFLIREILGIVPDNSFG